MRSADLLRLRRRLRVAVVAVSIAYLAVRRFIARPIWLGKVSPESGIIAVLIFILMVTLSRRMLVPEDTPPASVIWWTHTLALLIFLPLIPHTKHLHLVLSPATIFLKREGFSDIPKLTGRRRFRPCHRQRCHADRRAAGASPAWNADAAPSTAPPTTPAKN